MENISTNPFNVLLSELSIIHKKIDALNSKIESNAQSKTQAELIAELPDNLRTKHLKQIFGVSAVTLYHWCNRNLLRPQIIRGRKYYAKSDVLALLHQKQGK